MRSLEISLILILISVVLCQQPKLIMVNQLFRHGARYPIFANYDDGSGNYTFREHSLGQLTSNGKKMHYVLGQQLYKLYWNKLFGANKQSKRYNQSRFYIKSTDVNRTIESVQSQLMGLFEKLDALYIPENMTQFSKPQWIAQNASDLINITQGPVFPQAAFYHPMAIHVEKVGSNIYSSGDFLRTYSQQNCPNQKNWMGSNMQNSKFIQISNHQKFQKALQNLSAVVGKNVSFWDAYRYFDNYQCSKFMGKDFISTFKDQQNERALYYAYTLEMYMTLFSNPKQLSATATGFFNQTIFNIKKIISNKEQVQWNIYSAHDTTVGNMLAALNMTNVDCIYQGFLSGVDENTDQCITQYPKYTSNLIFEIWEYRSSAHLFKIRYNGQIRKIPFCYYSTECPVQVLYDWFDKWRDDDYLETCGVVGFVNEKIELYFSIAAAEFMIILVFILFIVVKKLKKKQSSSSSILNAKSTAPSPSINSLNDSLLSEQGKYEKQN